MIEFIIIDEDKKTLNNNKKIIEKVLMGYDYSYTIKTYNKKEKIELNSNNYKVYIIDYSIRNDKTLKIMQEIRKENNDWVSMLIVTTDNLSLKDYILRQRLMPVDIIAKDKDYEENLANCLKISMNNYSNRPNTLKYNYKNTYYNININSIIYIEKEKDNKRCIIKTKDGDYPIIGNLQTVEKLVDKRFIKSSRSYLINMEQVQFYNSKDNIIQFKDKTELYEISRSKKKDIINYLRGIE